MIKESEISDISDSSITYTNEVSGHKFLIAIAKTIEDEIWKELSDVVAFGVMINESIDIITTKHLDIYVSYVAKEEIFKTRFLCLVSLTECDAESITQVLINIFKKKEFYLNLQHLLQMMLQLC